MSMLNNVCVTCHVGGGLISFVHPSQPLEEENNFENLRGVLGGLKFVVRFLKYLSIYCSSVSRGVVAKKIGKGPVVALGSLAFLFLALLSRFVGQPAKWGWGVLVFYVPEMDLEGFDL